MAPRTRVKERAEEQASAMSDRPAGGDPHGRQRSASAEPVGDEGGRGRRVGRAGPLGPPPWRRRQLGRPADPGHRHAVSRRLTCDPINVSREETGDPVAAVREAGSPHCLVRPGAGVLDRLSHPAAALLLATSEFCLDNAGKQSTIAVRSVSDLRRSVDERFSKLDVELESRTRIPAIVELPGRTDVGNRNAADLAAVLVVGKSNITRVVVSKIVERSGLRPVAEAPRDAPAHAGARDARHRSSSTAAPTIATATISTLASAISAARPAVTCRAVILLSTSNGTPETLSLGPVVDAVVAKPITPENLQPVVDRLLETVRR